MLCRPGLFLCQHIWFLYRSYNWCRYFYSMNVITPFVQNSSFKIMRSKSRSFRMPILHWDRLLRVLLPKARHFVLTCVTPVCIFTSEAEKVWDVPGRNESKAFSDASKVYNLNTEYDYSRGWYLSNISDCFLRHHVLQGLPRTPGTCLEALLWKLKGIWNQEALTCTSCNAGFHLLWMVPIVENV